ncbi:MAG: hypothetical protein ACLGIV_10115 [Actinomycetes bacterium]
MHIGSGRRVLDLGSSALVDTSAVTILTADAGTTTPRPVTGRGVDVVGWS